ncbi:MAG: hypothetical protein KatS3mg067_2252 [Thermosynechococcus sp.]|nr:MAG: hypothetical protein KatS3mg067_2252 [Thermosynechococcus sp.]
MEIKTADAVFSVFECVRVCELAEGVSFAGVRETFAVDDEMYRFI